MKFVAFIFVLFAATAALADPLEWHLTAFKQGQPLARTDQPNHCYVLEWQPPYTVPVVVHRVIGGLPPQTLLSEPYTFDGEDIYSLNWQLHPSC